MSILANFLVQIGKQLLNKKKDIKNRQQGIGEKPIARKCTKFKTKALAVQK